MDRDMTLFEELYRLHAVDIRRFAFWLTGSVEDADDLTSEAFLRAFAGGRDLVAATVRSYLMTIVRNLHATGWRRRRRMESLDPEMVDPAPDAEACAQSRSEVERTLRALSQLGQDDRTALLLRLEGDLDYPEIARILGTTVSAARVRVHRARMRLVALLDHPGGRP